MPVSCSVALLALTAELRGYVRETSGKYEHVTVPIPPLREAARAIVPDADQRVLLLRYSEGGGF